MEILNIFLKYIQRPPTRRTTYASLFRHVGAFGLFFIAILDSSPLPTFGGPDVLTAILAGRRGEPWYYYAAAAALGSVVGAYLTFRFGRGAGSIYLENKFGARRVASILKVFERWGTGALLLSTLVPFPFPTSAFFAAAGVLNYPSRKLIMVVALGRSARYFAIAAIAALYGRRFIRVFSHPRQYPGWLLLIACLVSALTAATLFVRRRMEEVQN